MCAYFQCRYATQILILFNDPNFDCKSAASEISASLKVEILFHFIVFNVSHGYNVLFSCFCSEYRTVQFKIFYIRYTAHQPCPAVFSIVHNILGLGSCQGE